MTATQRQQVLAVLALQDPAAKCAACLQLPDDVHEDTFTPELDTEQLPGRLERPRLVPPQQARRRAVTSVAGV